jgi:hypothetical protein
VAGRTVQVLGYHVPTVLPVPAGTAGPLYGAPPVDLADADLLPRAQRFVDLLYWSRQAFSGTLASGALKVFVAPEGLFRRFVPDREDPTLFDPSAGQGHYPPGTVEQLGRAVAQALPAEEWGEWLVVAGAIEQGDAPDRATNALISWGPVGAKPRTRVLRERLEVPATPLQPQQVMAGHMAEPSRILRPLRWLDAWLHLPNLVVGIEATSSHDAGLLRESLAPISTALGTPPPSALQLVCSRARDLDPAQVVAVTGGLAVVCDGRFALDAQGRPSLSDPPRVAVSKVGGYSGPVAALTQIDPASTKTVPAPLQVAVPLPGYRASQAISIWRTFTLPG